jgi:hypothetical protein
MFLSYSAVCVVWYDLWFLKIHVYI